MRYQHQTRFLPKSYCGIVLAAVLTVGGSGPANAADVISGYVQNRTSGQPAVGDKVVLLRVEHPMQEVARTQTDSRGSFTLSVQYSEKPYLLRVVHQGVEYDLRASARDEVSVDVFDSATQVDGISGTIEIIRVGTVGSSLHVSDMVEIQNRSSPPRTQAGQQTYEVYLPPTGKIASVFAAGPGNTGVTILATPANGDPGHYSVNFPLRPGPTKFAFNYDLPYAGRTVFQTRHTYPLQQLAVMTPPTMKISSRSTIFRLLEVGNKSYQVRAIGPLESGLGPEFEVSGGGPIPPVQSVDQAAGPITPPANNWATASGRTTPSLGSLASTQPHLTDGLGGSRARSSASSSQTWMLGVLSLLLASLGALVIRPLSAAKRRSAQTASRTEESRRSSPLLEGLKEELFQLEAARIRGTISIEEYASTRGALEQTFKRVLRRGTSSVPFSPN